MNRLASVTIGSIAYLVLIAPVAAFAQTPTAPASPPPRLITYRGPEVGVDITAGRRGEAAFYLGATGPHSALDVRFSFMDAGAAIPCSIGVGYEQLFSNDRARITPVAGASIGRVFSCATESDGIRPAPAAHSVGTISGGIRIPMFAGRTRVGAIKVLVFSQRQFAQTVVDDTTSKGVSVGFVLGRR